MERTISLAELYELFSKLRIKDREYEDFPLEVEGITVDKEEIFNVLQKEVYAHSGWWMN